MFNIRSWAEMPDFGAVSRDAAHKRCTCTSNMRMFCKKAAKRVLAAFEPANTAA
ncbi:hypothetical protein [Aestuariibius sp. HNIBRBA575]|uniref:hypothetical protein n=1 Tax=Aestuariibius sp. HNIBRBA575 TaxID=3233343 RepID=UPI0034A201AD